MTKRTLLRKIKRLQALVKAYKPYRENFHKLATEAQACYIERYKMKQYEAKKREMIGFFERLELE